MDKTVSNTTQLLALEDLAVGQTFRSGGYKLDADQIKSFAKEYDPQPFHLDEQAARNSFFGELVASGWQTAAITMRLVVSSTPILGGVIGASSEVKWLRATKPGDTLTIESEIIEVTRSQSNPERGTARVRTTTLNQHGQRVQTMTSKLVVPARTTANQL